MKNAGWTVCYHHGFVLDTCERAGVHHCRVCMCQRGREGYARRKSESEQEHVGVGLRDVGEAPARNDVIDG